MSQSANTQSRWLYGWHAVTAALLNARHQIVMVACAEQRQDARRSAVEQLALGRGIAVHNLSTEQLAERVGDVRHQGVIAQVIFAPLATHLDDVLAELTVPPFLLVLDGVQDPHNLGACLRTADAMGVHAVIAPKDRAAPLSAAAAKVACGAAETVPYLTVTNLARSLREIRDAGIWIVGAAGEAEQDLYQFNHTGPLAIAMGNEGSGLRRLTREHCDQLIKIPMFGTVESLNVSVATAIILAEARRQRERA